MKHSNEYHPNKTCRIKQRSKRDVAFVLFCQDCRFCVVYIGLNSKFEFNLIRFRCALLCCKEVNQSTNTEYTAGQQFDNAHTGITKIESIES